MFSSASDTDAAKKQNDSTKNKDAEPEIEGISVRDTAQDEGGSSSTKSEVVVSVDLALRRLVTKAVENSFKDFSKVYDLYLQRFETQLVSLDQRIQEQERSRRMLEIHIDSCTKKSKEVEDSLHTIVNSKSQRGHKENSKGLTVSVLVKDESKSNVHLEKRIKRIETEVLNLWNSKGSKEDSPGFAVYDIQLNKLSRKAETLFQDAAKCLEKQKCISEELEQSLQKLSNIVTSAESVKHFVERNICIRSDAESLVKEQVSLITKQICVEMRRNTSKSLKENSDRIGERLKRSIKGYENDLEILFHECS